MTEFDLILRARHKNSCETTTFFNRADLIDERALHNLKWFDYRFMSPREATGIFRTEYQRIYRWKYGHYIDTEKSETKFGVRAGIPERHKAEFTSFWRVRQFADQLGMPYAVFLEAAFNVLMRGGWRRIPYINQLHGKNKVRIAVAATELWKENCNIRLMFSPLPHYQAESFRGLAAQVAHQDWVLEQLKTGTDSAIGRACFTWRILPEERAKAEFGEERLENARACAAEEASEVHKICELPQLLPSCVMLPGALDISSPECSTCKVANFCTRSEASVRQTVTLVTGVADPEEDRRRRLGRDRVRKHRQKTKLAAETTFSVESRTPYTGGI